MRLINENPIQLACSFYCVSQVVELDTPYYYGYYEDEQGGPQAAKGAAGAKAPARAHRSGSRRRSQRSRPL